MIGDKDQEEIFKLYEDFRGIEQIQPSTNPLFKFTRDAHNSTGVWNRINSPGYGTVYTPRHEQEEGESNFKFKDRQGNLYTFLRTKGDLFILRSDRQGIVLEIPKDKMPSLFEEV